MATRSPTRFHNYWGQFALVSDLPNPPYDSIGIEVGDLAYVLDDSNIYKCTDATVGATVWEIVSGNGGLTEAQILERVWAMS